MLAQHRVGQASANERTVNPTAITAITCQHLRVTSIRFASLQRLNTDHSRVILAAHGQTALNPTHTGHLD